MKKSILFDRDGTLIRDKGYMKSVSQVDFYAISYDIMRELNREYLFFIVSNQSGIGKGHIQDREVMEINSYITGHFLKKKIIFSGTYYCPHVDQDNCQCKKPHTGFIKEISKAFHIDHSRSFVIGDHPSDMLFAVNGRMKGIYVLTGHGKRHSHEIRKIPDPSIVIKNNINQALRYIKESK